MICGKVIYESQEAANRATSGHNSARKRTDKQKIRGSYFCSECNGWHVHTQRKKKKGWVVTDQDHNVRTVIEKKPTYAHIIHSKLVIK